jgi:integrase
MDPTFSMIRKDLDHAEVRDTAMGRQHALKLDLERVERVQRALDLHKSRPSDCIGFCAGLAFAHDRGWIDANPLRERVRKIRHSRQQGANRPWTEEECRIVLDRAPSQLKLPIALAMFAGLRKSDFLQISRAAIRGDMITVRTSKRGVAVSIPLHPLLKAAIDDRPSSDAVQLAVTSRGQPWTESGFNASFAKFKKALEAEGAISPGLTPHGLRHTLGTKLREAGADDRTIADVLGQRSTSMARHYSENAELPEAASALVSRVNPTGANKG